MYLIYFPSFGYYSHKRFDTVACAMAYAGVVGFVAEIRDEKTRKAVRHFTP